METLRPDYDLIQAAMNLSKKHRLDLQVYHVKSHQDDAMEYIDLPWEAKLKVACDALAASVRTCTQCNHNKTTKYRLPPGHRATLLLNQTWVTSHLPTTIKEESYRIDLVEYIMKRAGWDSSKIFDMVDQEARARANQTIKGEQRTTIFNYVLFLGECSALLIFSSYSECTMLAFVPL